MKRRSHSRGFTMMEVLVAMFIMGVAVLSLIQALSQTARNAGRVSEHDRVTSIARRKMDELLALSTLPRGTVFGGQFDTAQVGGVETGWQAQITILERPPSPSIGAPIMDRIQLQIWWVNGGHRNTFEITGYRRGYVKKEDIERGLLPPAPPQGAPVS